MACMTLAESVRRGWRRHLTEMQIDRRARVLVEDMRDGSLPVCHPLPGRPFTEEDARREHDGFVAFLMSDDFGRLMAELGEAGHVDGIEALGATGA